jgi:hypothetical protein
MLSTNQKVRNRLGTFTKAFVDMRFLSDIGIEKIE